MSQKLLASELYGWRLERKNFCLVDMRSDDEFEKEHIPGAILFAEYEQKKEEFAKKEIPIVFYWTDTPSLLQIKFTDYYLQGGYESWRELKDKLLRKCRT